MGKGTVWTDRLMVPIAHFSHAVRVGDLVHVGATAGTDADRRLPGESPGRVDAAAQARRMFDNLDTALEGLGAGRDDLVRIKAYVADPRDIPAYEAIYAGRFAGRPLAHAVVGSWGFPLPQAALELDAVAVVRTSLPAKGSPDGRWAMVPDGAFYGTAQPRAGPPDAEAQVRAAFADLLGSLGEGGLAPGDLCNLHVTLSDMRDLAACEAVAREMLVTPLPSRTVVAAPLPRPDLLVQIEAVAHLGGGQPIPDPGGPGSDDGAAATLAGDILYIGGQTGIGPRGERDIEAQTRAAWARVDRLVLAAGFPPGSILRTNNVLTDWRDYAGFNAGYGAHVARPYPPRATVLGGLRDPRALVQVEAVAHRAGAQARVLQAVGAP